MKTLYTIGIFAWAIFLPCVSTADSGSDSSAGLSLETAIELECVSDGIDGVAKERVWFELHYPGYRKTGQGLLTPDNGEAYDEITLEKDGDKKIIYFVITEWFGVFEPIDLPPECDAGAT